VAIAPAPCPGDPAFDAVDLLIWGAEDVDTVVDRAERLGRATGLDAVRMLGWCIAFAGMAALEWAAAGTASNSQVEAVMTLADRA
jgi:streptomycin 6-kinase